MLGYPYGKENLVLNINDVPLPEILKGTSLIDLARIMAIRQTELEDKYFEIEKRKNRFIFSLDDRDSQVLIKDFLWRITEEVGEAIEAYRESTTLHSEKVFEELADGLHFVLGLTLNLCKPDIWDHAFSERDQLYDTPVYHCYDFIQSIGTLGNTLKLKPWKQTDVATDITQFDSLLSRMIKDYLLLCWSFGLTHHTLYQYYMRKSEVNLFRIRSLY